MFCYFYLLADFLKTMKNTRFFASFFANRKKKKRQAARAAGAEGFPAGRRAAQAANLPTEREEARGRETAPAALPRDKQSKKNRSPERSESGEAAWALERVRARK